MFRSNWDRVSPTLWLGDLAGEEAIFGGETPEEVETTFLILLPNTERSSRQSRSQDKTESSTSDAQTAETAETQQLLNEDFFEDLPLGARHFETRVPATLAPPKTKTRDGYAFMTYSYSCCTTLDDDNRPVESARRRYEDSSGCLKAVHRRTMGDTSMQSSWVKTSEGDEGTHSKHVTAGNVKSFEKKWAKTPFGSAERHARKKGEMKQTELPDAPPPHEIP
ncbi:hypothetical protein ATCC90586_001422 [Pythium insidiosum]|nr:hypothetical protein ATCC90586_001422 [Pythium insidiosum]